jgi:hypothetical protein
MLNNININLTMGTVPIVTKNIEMTKHILDYFLTKELTPYLRFSFCFFAYFWVEVLKNLRYSCNSQKFFLYLHRDCD